MTPSKQIEAARKSDTDQGEDRIEALRCILERQQGHATYEEAREVGDALIEFYEVLAEGADDEPRE